MKKLPLTNYKCIKALNTTTTKSYGNKPITINEGEIVTIQQINGNNILISALDDGILLGGKMRRSTSNVYVDNNTMSDHFILIQDEAYKDALANISQQVVKPRHKTVRHSHTNFNLID